MASPTSTDSGWPLPIRRPLLLPQIAPPTVPPLPPPAPVVATGAPRPDFTPFPMPRAKSRKRWPWRVDRG
jgi:hypothetical protein